MKQTTRHLAAMSFILLLTQNIFSQSVSTTKSNFIPDEKIVANFSGFPGNASDWLAVAPVGFADDKSNQWYYTGGGSSGTITFSPQPVGVYEIRGYFNNGYEVKARYRFTVGFDNNNPAITPTVKTQKSVYLPTETVTVDFTNFLGDVQDWIAIAPVGYADDKSIQWKYTDGKQSGSVSFTGIPEGNYEARGYFKNGYEVRARYQFTVSKVITGTASNLCRRELSLFYAGVGGLGSAWGRAATEPLNMNPGAVTDMQAVITNTKAALELVKCVPYDVKKIDALKAKLPTLTSVQAVQEIEIVIKEIQAAVAQVKLDCGNSSTLMALYSTGIHMGAAQAWASSRMFQPAPMPSEIQTVIFNHLKTAQEGFAGFLPCVPWYNLSAITATSLNSTNSVLAHIGIIMTSCDINYNIALSDCCCSCK